MYITWPCLVVYILRFIEIRTGHINSIICFDSNLNSIFHFNFLLLLILSIISKRTINTNNKSRHLLGHLPKKRNWYLRHTLCIVSVRFTIDYTHNRKCIERHIVKPVGKFLAFKTSHLHQFVQVDL